MLKTNHGRFAAILVSLLALTAVADEAVDPADADDEAAKKYDEIIVTGTRLLKGDPSARVDVITSEDIEARGLSTAEQVIRSIPQNLSTINITSNNSLSIADGGNKSLHNGQSTANLRGFGSANTLVLLNGKRMSGSYGNHDAVVNLRDIPAAAIERVEVHLDGGSSVYGADGVAGVINIITKKGFKGGHVDVRAETSSTGADSMRYSGYFGTSWDGGSVSLNASHTDSKPYSSYKAGFTTKDHSGMFGGNPIYNFNIFGRVVDDEYIFDFASHYRSAIVKTSQFSRDWLILPAGDDGRNAQPGDFQPVSAADAIEVLGQDVGGSTLDTSYLLDIEHTFADKVRVRGSYSYTEAETKTREAPAVSIIPVPASNAFNNFTAPDPVSGEPVPIDVFVQYRPTTEVELGLIPPQTKVNNNQSDRILLGFDVFLSDGLEWTFDYVKATTENDLYDVTITDSYGVDSLPARYFELLASSDPNVAFNPFGDGTGQNPTIAEMVVPFRWIKGNEVSQFETYLRGSAFDLPAGELGWVFGYEHREERARGNVFPFRQGEDLENYGVAEPGRDVDAYFAEISLPIFSETNSRPGFDSLTITASARRDEYTIDGSFENDPVTNEPILVSRRFSQTSPRIGFDWNVSDSWEIRGSYGEAFRAPTAEELFSGQQFSLPFCLDPLTGGIVFGCSLIFGPNPELRPESSDNLSLGIAWTPPAVEGLRLQIDYSEIDFQDRISSSGILSTTIPPETLACLPEFYKWEGECGDSVLLEAYGFNVNINARYDRTLDVQGSWEIETDSAGTFIPSFYYHKVLEHYDQARADTPKVDFTGQIIGPDEYRLQGRLEWFKDNVSVNLLVDYIPSYRNTTFNNFGASRPIPEMKVDSRTTVDLTAQYRWDDRLTITAGGRNIFDADFPFSLGISGVPFDGSRVDGRGQVWFAELNYDFGW